LSLFFKGILKKAPEDQCLYKLGKDKHIAMEDSKQLSEYGYLHTTARAQLPETIGLAYRIAPEGEKEEFEPLEITPVSTPPDLPDVMKGEASNPSQANMESSDK
jgi:transcription elongation factor B subunit 2